jgi:hypothetical protein
MSLVLKNIENYFLLFPCLSVSNNFLIFNAVLRIPSIRISLSFSGSDTIISEANAIIGSLSKRSNSPIALYSAWSVTFSLLDFSVVIADSIDLHLIHNTDRICKSICFICKACIQRSLMLFLMFGEIFPNRSLFWSAVILLSTWRLIDGVICVVILL